MSFEGYYQVRCVNNHYYTEDCYTFSHSEPCKKCGGAILKSNSVDETNGNAEGFDPEMENGAEIEVTVWEGDYLAMKMALKEVPLWDGDLETRTTFLREYSEWKEAHQGTILKLHNQG